MLMLWYVYLNSLSAPSLTDLALPLPRHANQTVQLSQDHSKLVFFRFKANIIGDRWPSGNLIFLHEMHQRGQHMTWLGLVICISIKQSSFHPCGPHRIVDSILASHPASQVWILAFPKFFSEINCLDLNCCQVNWQHGCLEQWTAEA